jgi:lipopolysaccharide transport system ATP-binding protein
LFHTRPGYNKNEYVWGDGTVRIEDFLITNAAGSAYPPELDAAETVTITVRARFLDDVPDPLFGLLIKTVDGVYVHGTNSLIEQGPAASSARHAGDLVEFTFRLVPALVAGHYLLSFGVSADGGLVPLGRRYDSVLVAVRNPRPVTGLVDLRAWFEERVAPDA